MRVWPGRTGVQNLPIHDFHVSPIQERNSSYWRERDMFSRYLDHPNLSIVNLPITFSRLWSYPVLTRGSSAQMETYRKKFRMCRVLVTSPFYLYTCF
jgi:hypothetical protein